MHIASGIFPLLRCSRGSLEAPAGEHRTRGGNAVGPPQRAHRNVLAYCTGRMVVFGVFALSSWMASNPTLNRPSASICTVTQAWASSSP